MQQTEIAYLNFTPWTFGYKSVKLAYVLISDKIVAIIALSEYVKPCYWIFCFDSSKSLDKSLA